MQSPHLTRRSVLPTTSRLQNTDPVNQSVVHMLLSKLEFLLPCAVLNRQPTTILSMRMLTQRICSIAHCARRIHRTPNDTKTTHTRKATGRCHRPCLHESALWLHDVGLMRSRTRKRDTNSTPIPISHVVVDTCVRHTSQTIRSSKAMPVPSCQVPCEYAVGIPIVG